MTGGAAVANSVKAFLDGDRSKWVMDRVHDHWFGYSKGRKIIFDSAPPRVRAKLDSEFEKRKLRKRHEKISDAEPKLLEKPVKPLHNIVTFWLVGPQGGPGFAWCGDKAAIALLQGAAPGIDAKIFERTYQRAGLKKIEPIVYHAASSGGRLVLTTRTHIKLYAQTIPTL